MEAILAMQLQHVIQAVGFKNNLQIMSQNAIDGDSTVAWRKQHIMFVVAERNGIALLIMMTCGCPFAFVIH